MQIRAGLESDVPQLLPMVAKLARLHQSWDPERYAYRSDVGAMYDSWLRQRARDPDSVLIVAEVSESHIVGFLVATVEHDIPIYTTGKYGFIHDVWVEEDYRHEGIARQMTMLAVERFKSMGISQVRLETAEANDAARALFASCGFRTSTTEMMLH